MRFGLSTYLFVDHRLGSHTLDQIHSAGFQEIEIFAARQHFDYHDANHIRDVGQWFSDHEFALHSLHAPLFSDKEWGRSGKAAVSVAHLERRHRIESMDEIKRALEVAEAIPFRYLVLHLGVEAEDYNLKKFDAAFTSLEHLKIFAKERGVQLLLENTPNELSTPERLLEFLQYTRLDLKLCFDTGHAHLTGNVQSAFLALKDLIVSTHVHDNRHEEDDHLLPFDGDINWKETVRDLRSTAAVPFVFELREYGPEITTLARVREVVKKLEAMG